MFFRWNLLQLFLLLMFRSTLWSVEKERSIGQYHLKRGSKKRGFMLRTCPVCIRTAKQFKSSCCFESLLYVVHSQLNYLKFYTCAKIASISRRVVLIKNLLVSTTKFLIFLIVYRLCYQFEKVASALLSFCLVCSNKVLPFVLVCVD